MAQVGIREWYEARGPRCPVADTEFAVRTIDAILSGARDAGASDVHLVPGSDEIRMSWRLDGVLHPVAEFPAAAAPRLIARLKVLAELLTYQTELPQEGRIRTSDTQGMEMRLSTFPTLFGEKAVIRLLGEQRNFGNLDSLGLDPPIAANLVRALSATGGCLVVCGPAGSGKTTTLYACLRDLVDKSGGQRSLVSMEDPIEAVLPGVAQSQVNLAAGFDLHTGLRSLLRQDPEVIMVGEIRDRSTAEIVFTAALTGHLVLTTFHAGSACEALSRLSDLGLESYLLRSGLRGVVCQRLLRRLCDCKSQQPPDAQTLGLDVPAAWHPVGCETCRQTGYRGRMVLAEWLPIAWAGADSADLAQVSTGVLTERALARGMIPIQQRALEAVACGDTSPEEYRRVLGFGTESGL